MVLSVNYFNAGFIFGGDDLVWVFKGGDWEFIGEDGGFTMAMKKVFYWLIPIVVGVLIMTWLYWGGGGLWGGMKDMVKGAMEIVPEIKVGAEELEGEKPRVPRKHEGEIRNLVEGISLLLGGKERDCFMNYGKLPDLEGTLIRLEENRIEVSREGQIDEELTKELRGKLKGFRPCVIAGEDVLDNFYYTVLEPRAEKVKGDYYKKVGTITIAWQGGFLGLSKKNRVDYGEGFKDLEDGGWLFSPDGEHVCLFSTNKYIEKIQGGCKEEPKEEEKEEEERIAEPRPGAGIREIPVS